MLGILVVMASQPAAALWKKSKKTGEKRAMSQHAVDRDLYPTMVFRTGILRRASASNWQLGSRPLVMVKASTVSVSEGSPGQLVEGRMAVVMGYWRNGSLVVHHASVLGAGEAHARGLDFKTRVYGEPEKASGRILH